jgi:hypothetical protein
VWKSQGDTRDVISIGKLVRRSDGPLEIEGIRSTIAKYDNMMMQRDMPRDNKEMKSLLEFEEDNAIT